MKRTLRVPPTKPWRLHPPALLLFLLAGFVLPSSLRAQYEIKSGVYNRLSERVPANNTTHIAPVGPAGSPVGEPTVTPQFSNVVEAAGAAGPISTGYPKSVTAGTGVIVQMASIGTSVASGVPRYFFGDVIIPPAAITSTAGVRSPVADPPVYWRAKPVTPEEVLTNPDGSTPADYRTGQAISIPPLPSGQLASYYYSPHARKVFANTPGNVDIVWRSSAPENGKYVFYTERFTVSSATDTPARSIFWTEKSFNGPRVAIPSGRIVTVNPVYSNVFPETVPTEYVVTGASSADPNASATKILRTLWYEKNNGVGELHAYNQQGRILLEYLGDLRADGSHEFLGADILNVQQSLKPQTITVKLGQEIRPNPDENLLASPVTTGNTSNQTTYYGSNPKPDGTLAYYAERENDIEDRVVFYWLEANDAAIPETAGTAPGLVINWPKYLNKYLQIWPTTLEFVQSTVGHGGSSVASGTGLKFEDGKIPAIIYQDSATGEAQIDTVTQRFIVNLGVSVDQSNRALLKFNGANGGVWYVPVMTQADDRIGYEEGDGSSTLTGTVYVGDRIQPPSAAYVPAAYIAGGTSYLPAAYIDPFANGVDAAQQGAIIPVNALPGSRNPLTLWWFKKVPAKSAEFTDFYTAAKVGRYNVAYRTSNAVTSEDFNDGATGWSNNTTATTSVPNDTAGKFLGPFASAPGTVAQKTFSLPVNAGNSAELSFTLYRLDSWDGESLKVIVDGHTLITQPLTMAEVKTPASGSVTIGNTIYTWILAPVPGSFVNFYGDPAFIDQKFQIHVILTPTNGTELSKVTLGLASTLDSGITDESYGIDDLSLSLSLPQIVLASNQGTGTLSTAVSNGSVYNQPDPLKPGYNPNEEHALMLGGRGYALRDDLNIRKADATFSSLPRVLIQYTDPSDGRPSMAVYEVLRESPLYRFSYNVTAATILSAPMPLPLMPLPLAADGSVKNTEVTSASADPPAGAGAAAAYDYYQKFTFKDRKGYDWVYRGPHDQGSPSLGMQFYYTMRPDFVFPDKAAQPVAGTPLPFLRTMKIDGTYEGDSVSGTPLTIKYFPVWPESPPLLSVGETLALPKNGLPAVRGQTSARVLYQQSIANTGTTTPSVTLHDATRAKSVLLDDSRINMSTLPNSLKTTSQNGKTYFQLAQPHLQQRFYFDPLIGDIGGLVLIGQFVDEIAGEDYFNLNVLSADDASALKSLVDVSDTDRSKWEAAVEALYTTVETFKEDPQSRGTWIVDSTKSVNRGSRDLAEISYSDTAVDSYALTARGKGSGYVTLLFGDGEAFTPQGEPVAMEVIKVQDQLYQGDLKKVSASNPLDEQTSLRHSGDFAAHPEDYDFEWRYGLPIDGVAPAIYTNSMRRVLGTLDTNSWYLLSNPQATPPSVLPYPATPVPLERSILVNDAAYTDHSGQPGQILKSAAGLTFDSAVATQIVFSAKLGVSEGLVLYVNGVPALAYQIPPEVIVPGNLIPQAARSGLADDGLPYQFKVDPAFFHKGANQIEIALYSSQLKNGAPTAVDFRMHTPLKTDLVLAPGSSWQAPNGTLTNTVIIGGSAASPLGDPLLVFSDTYFTMRYKAKASAQLVTGEAYSEWMQPVLVESWVKRVLDGINPFNQRQTDLYNNPISTDVSILTQAGKRWEGDVALNLENIDSFGLIEIYETVLNRVKNQSIDQTPPATTDSVNSTLLLAAGYLNDLYMTLGNEAWDDAQNPTLMVDASAADEDISSARFSFEGQAANMMDETLDLLRGRDDFVSPGVRTAPAYNRLYWNYINGINSGEPIYATNYNIKEKAGSANANGVIDAADAQAMFPQGHGDAYGHYLTALTGYYKLLTADGFEWKPSSEAVDVLGQTVQVDYKDERKFAAAAAAVARTGVDILDFTARSLHEDGEEQGWKKKHDGKRNPSTGLTRYWGTDEWSQRVFQGAYFNWVSANAMLPPLDTVHEGIQKIDRTTVPELGELVTSAARVTSLSMAEQGHLNPLGLATDSMAFDISPTDMAAGKSHFEQIYARASKAALNARNAFRQAGKMNRMLRQQNNSEDDYNEAVQRQEAAYQYQLITLFGTPYAGDIGPGKLYAQGYTGPDLYHSYFIDKPSPLVDTDRDVTVNFREPVDLDAFKDPTLDDVYNSLRDEQKYTVRTYKISPSSIAQFSDMVTGGLGKRGQAGKIQEALLACWQAQVNLRDSANTFTNLSNRFDRDYQLYTELLDDYKKLDDTSDDLTDKATKMSKSAVALAQVAAGIDAAAEYTEKLGEATKEAPPEVVGVANDVTAPVRSAILVATATGAFTARLVAVAMDGAAKGLEADASDKRAESSLYFNDFTVDKMKKEHVVEFVRLYDEVVATAFEMTRRLSELQAASEQVSRLYAEANHVLSERQTFRQRAAAVVQGYRTRDLVYRNLRNEELSQYKGLFDLAQSYAYLTAKAYDYETGLLDSAQGKAYINSIIGTYSIGNWNGEAPVNSGAGDSGLAAALGGLRDDWEVVKGRLGINNPDRNGTVFSLRQELFRIRADQPTADDDLVWKQVLQQHIMSNVLNDPDVAIHANGIRKADGSAVPGLVISFSTTIEPGLNFFGWPLAAGDHAFSQSNYATKIFSSGLVFTGYVGMDPYAIGIPGAGGPASSAPNALSATPYAYLIPAGVDSMRAPPLGDTNRVRSWTVKDQAIPLPLNLGASQFSATQFFTPSGSINEELWIPRKHPAFRPVDDPAYFYSSMPGEFTNSRLIGRSVWNSQWKIVIPAYTLLNDEQKALDRFTKSVRDIKLFLRTYSTSGN